MNSGHRATGYDWPRDLADEVQLELRAAEPVKSVPVLAGRATQPEPERGNELRWPQHTCL